MGGSLHFFAFFHYPVLKSVRAISAKKFPRKCSEHGFDDDGRRTRNSSDAEDGFDGQNIFLASNFKCKMTYPRIINIKNIVTLYKFENFFLHF